MVKIKREDVKWEIIAEQDDLDVQGNAVASGDDLLDKEVEDEILSRLNDGDVWAWAQVEVLGTWNGLSASDYLGACSYKDEEDFCQPGGYYESMRDEVLASLKEQAERILAACIKGEKES